MEGKPRVESPMAEKCPRCGAWETGRVEDRTAFGEAARALLRRDGASSGKHYFECGAVKHWRKGQADIWKHPDSCALRVMEWRVEVLKKALHAMGLALAGAGSQAAAAKGKGKGRGTAACGWIEAEAMKGLDVLGDADVAKAMGGA